jgi:hypothetical protein
LAVYILSYFAAKKKLKFSYLAAENGKDWICPAGNNPRYLSAGAVQSKRRQGRFLPLFKEDDYDHQS